MEWLKGHTWLTLKPKIETIELVMIAKKSKNIVSKRKKSSRKATKPLTNKAAFLSLFLIGLVAVSAIVLFGIYSSRSALATGLSYSNGQPLEEGTLVRPNQVGELNVAVNGHSAIYNLEGGIPMVDIGSKGIKIVTLTPFNAVTSDGLGLDALNAKIPPDTALRLHTTRFPNLLFEKPVGLSTPTDSPIFDKIYTVPGRTSLANLIKDGVIQPGDNVLIPSCLPVQGVDGIPDATLYRSFPQLDAGGNLVPYSESLGNYYQQPYPTIRSIASLPLELPPVLPTSNPFGVLGPTGGISPALTTMGMNLPSMQDYMNLMWTNAAMQRYGWRNGQIHSVADPLQGH